MKKGFFILLASLALLALHNPAPAFAADDSCGDNTATLVNGVPAPPQFPRDFEWTGRWVVKDLVPPIDVPLTWQGNDGSGQMTAGSNNYPVYFTNLIYNNKLYTKTYKWPSVVPPAPSTCACLGGLTLEKLNACVGSARYVGEELLEDETPHCVNHFRIAVVLPVVPPPRFPSKKAPFTIPLMEGDFYVDQQDSSKFWKVLHFGFQNVLDPALDEWAVLETFDDSPGQITLPLDCSLARCPRGDAFPPGVVCK
ncbi:MAG TPA: hypothetical protein VJN94_04550 [Candidatus Binataceae bacterium]|nr:hypothetical protein [Candidatus Binataceae bacterium]